MEWLVHVAVLVVLVAVLIVVIMSDESDDFWD